MSSYLKSLSLILLLALGACAHHKSKEELARHPEETPPATASAKPPESSIEAKQVAAEEEASYVTEFAFQKGKNILTPDAESRLSKLLHQANTHGKIEDVKVITWADAEYPSVHERALSKGQVDLASRRNEEIKRFLKSSDKNVKVSTYNMAERPFIFSDFFATANARVKKSLEVAGIPNSDTSIKSPAKASKAIVMVILKE